MAEPTAYQYRAFISYSHADTSWAKWLHRALETFRIDKDLAGRETPTGTIPKSLRPIFRDRDDFTAGHSLTDQTRAALDASAALIVICSPAAAKSGYVTEEIRLFKSRHPDRPVIPLIVEGTPDDSETECFPRSLKFKLTAKGQVGRRKAELLAADARESGDGKNLALAKVVAGLLGVSSDDIYRRAERDRRHRSRLRNGVIAVLAFLAVAASGSAVYAWQQLKTNEAFLTATLKTATEIVNTAVTQSNTYGIPRSAALALLTKAEGLFNNMSLMGRPTPELRLQKAWMLIQFARNYEILGDTEKQEARAEEAYRLMTELYTERPDDPGSFGLLSAALFEKGKVIEAQGNLKEASGYYKRGLDVVERLAKTDLDNKNYQNEVAIATDRLGDSLRAQGDLPGALEYYKKGATIREKLVKAEPKNAKLLNGLAISYNRAGKIGQAEGKLAEALRMHEKSLSIVKYLADAAPKDPERQDDLAICYEQVGDVLKAQGNYAKALEVFQKSFEIRDRLAKVDTSHARWQHSLSIAYEKLGDVSNAQGDLSGALKFYRDSLAIRSRLATEDPRNTLWQRDLSVTYMKIGNVLDTQGDVTGALKSYRDALAIRERLAKTDESNANWQIDLALIHRRIGEVLIAQDDPDGALTAYLSSLDILNKLTEDHPKNDGWYSDVSVTLEGLGDVEKARGNFAIALKHFKNSLGIREILSKAAPENATRKRDISVSYNKIGDVLRAQDDLPGALAAYREALEIRIAPSDEAPETAPRQRDLAFTYGRIGRTLNLLGKFGEALDADRKNLSLTKALLAKHESNAEWQGDFDRGVAELGNLAYNALLAHDFVHALEASDDAIALAPEETWLRTNRAHALLFLGRVDEARALYLKYRGTENVSGDKSWEPVVIDDFAAMREAGLDHPLMEEIESAFQGAAKEPAPEAAQAEHAAQ